MARIRGIILFIQFSITVAITVVCMYLFKNHVHKVIKTWMDFQIWVLGIKFEIEGSLDESCDMLIINHQSLLDIIVIEYLHSRHIAWVAKKELENLFFFGHIIKAPKMISIDRENKAGIIHLLKEAKDRISKNRPIAMFPEGTRSDGKKMLKFRPGAKLVANKLNLKVQPIVIFNTRNIVDSQKLEVRSGIVKIVFLETVQASKDSSWFEDTEVKMNEVFQKECSNYDS